MKASRFYQGRERHKLIKRFRQDTQLPDWTLPKADQRLYKPLIRFNKKGDHLTLLQCLAGGVMAIGSSGSGKTSTIHMLTEKMMQAGCSLVYFTYKAEESEKLARLAKRAGREDVFVYRPEEHPFNPLLDMQELTRGSISMHEQLVSMVMTGTQRASEGGGGESKTWAGIASGYVFAIVVLCDLAGKPLSYQLIEQVLTSLPVSEEQAQSLDWIASSIICDLLKLAESSPLSPAQSAEIERAARVLLVEAAQLGPRARSSVIMTVKVGLSVLSRGMIGDALCLPVNTWSPKELVVDRPGVIIFDTSLQKYGESAGLTLAQQLKHVLVYAITNRDLSLSRHPIFLVCDELAQLVDETDAQSMAVLRESRAAFVGGVQCVSQLSSACAKFSRDGRSMATTLLGLPSVLICNACGDPETLQFMEQRLGSAPSVNFSMGSNESDRSQREQSTRSSGRSEQFSEAMKPETPAYQIARLARGGPEYNCHVEFLLSISGRRFKGSGGKSTLKVRFKQILL